MPSTRQVPDSVITEKFVLANRFVLSNWKRDVGHGVGVGGGQRLKNFSYFSFSWWTTSPKILRMPVA